MNLHLTSIPFAKMQQSFTQNPNKKLEHRLIVDFMILSRKSPKNKIVVDIFTAPWGASRKDVPGQAGGGPPKRDKRGQGEGVCKQKGRYISCLKFEKISHGIPIRKLGSDSSSGCYQGSF